MRRLLVPLAILLSALAIDHGLLSVELPESSLLLGRRLLFGAAFLLAWRFRRGRLALTTVLLAALSEALYSGVGTPVLPAVAVLLPLHLAALPFLREWWVASGAGLLRLGLVAVEVYALSWWADARSPDAFAFLEGHRLSAPPPSLPAGALVAFTLAALLLLYRALRLRSPLEAGLFGTLAAAFALLESHQAGAPASTLVLYSLATAIILTLATLDSAFALAFEDGLTGLPARRALEEHLRHLGRGWSVAMVDIDHFKKLNDRHGHEVGDQVLRKVAGRLAKVRGGQAFRYGGEEFTLVFPGKTVDEAKEAAETVRAAVADEPFTVRSPARPAKTKTGKARRGQGGGEKSLKVTVSAGVAARSDQRPAPEDVLKAADKALYRAKKAGRNRVAVGK
jgi:diguanylate cyclase (GGDEF)-like protein